MINYLLHVLILVCIYSILAVSLNLLVGYTGLLSVCHAAFYGIGAYTSSLLTLKLGWNFFPAMCLAIIINGIAGALIAIPTLRIKGDYFVIASFAFQIIIYSIFYNWIGLTRGPFGLVGIPKPTMWGYSFYSYYSYALLAFFLAFICFFISRRLVTLPIGRILKAIREDEIATLSVGKNVIKYKIGIFIIASSLTAVSGTLFAHYVNYIDPTSFPLTESIFIFSIVIIGGAANLTGSVLGTAVLFAIPEILRFLHIPNHVAAPLREMIYGALLIIFMRFRPQGLIGEYGFK